MTAAPRHPSASLQPVPTPEPRLLDRFTQLRAELTSEIFEADDRIDGALVALVAGEHMAMIGAPGTAKTHLFKRLAGRISGANVYSELMKKTMPPEDVVGQVSILGMKVDNWHKVTTGMLPEADLALLDEFTRTSDAILAGILGILNEREFKNGAVTVQCPLSTAFLCSNSFPTGESDRDLEAFWDRVVMRFEVEPPKDRATWKAIARQRLDPKPPVVLSWDDVLAAKAEARALPFTEAAWDALDDIRDGLARLGITVTGRRYGICQYVASAWAWLQGADEVLPEHLEILTHMLWEVPEQRPTVERTVVGIASPGQKEAIKLADAVQELLDLVEAALAKPDDSQVATLNQLRAKMVDQKDELVAFLDTASGGAERRVDTALRLLTAGQIKLMKVGFGVDLEQVANLRGR